VCDTGGEAHPFSVVPDSSSVGSGSDGLVCPLLTHSAAESCCHCCYVAIAAVFLDAKFPHPRHPEISYKSQASP
jgi:hypothetical protein